MRSESESESESGRVMRRDGKIVEAWNNFDFARLNQQIGLA